MKKTISIITMIAAVVSALAALYLIAERKGWLDRFCTCDDDCYWCDDDCDCLDFCDCDECDCEETSDETPTEE